MTKQYKLKDLDCANCARKMQDAIQKIDGVQSATVNFMAQKLTLDLDDHRIDQILEQVKTAIRRIEPDCVIMG